MISSTIKPLKQCLRTVSATALLALTMIPIVGAVGGGPKSWGNAVTIDISTMNAYDPKMAMDVAGNAVVVWEQDDGAGSDRNIWASRYDVATDLWGIPTLIETNNGDARDPQMAMNAAGVASAVWWQDDGTGIDDIWANRYDVATGLWGTATLIETNNGNASWPRIAIDDGGETHVVWRQDDGMGIDDIWANRYDVATGLWGTASLIETNSGDAGHPQIATNARGDASAVWWQVDGTSATSIGANRYDTATGLWGTATLIETYSGEAGDPQTAIDAAGNVDAVWWQEDGTGVPNIGANRYDVATDLWGTATLIETYSGDAGGPQIATNTAGKAVTVWWQDDATGVPNIGANHYDAITGQWGTTTLIETDIGMALHPKTAIDAAGKVLAVWWQDDGTGVGDNWANAYDSTTGLWGTATLIETSAAPAFAPRVAMSASGHGFAVWEQDDGTGVIDIVVNHYR